MERKIGPRVLAVLAVLALVLAACGESKKDGTTPKLTGSKGGTLKLIASGDVDYIDPGQNYYTFGYGLFRVIVRNLMSFPPLDGPEGLIPVPDVAADDPEISADGTTFTFKIRQGVKFGPPVNRQVTSKDFKYGIERAFKPGVGGQYLFYLTGAIGPALVGAKDFEDGKATEISGIRTPDDETIVFELESPRSDFASLIAGLPQYAPVPVEYATPHDAKSPTTYGEFQVSSGPYMFKNDSKGNIKGAGLGWDPGKKIILVRNPNWSEATDPIRKAFPDEIHVDEGFSDAAIASDKIVQGEYDYNWDFAIPSDKVQSIRANATQSTLLTFNPAPCVRYVALNTTISPFDNVHVRRAVAWVLNRDAMRKSRGGAEAGEFAPNALFPGLAGFDESGGRDFDPYKTDKYQGDVTKALEEMKLAKADGVANIGDDGKYTGSAITIVGGNAGAAPGTTLQVQASLAKIGIKTTIKEYDPDVVYTNWYNVPAKKVTIASNPAWCYDYPNAASWLFPLVRGPGAGGQFPAVKNNNISVFNDQQTNDLIAQASSETDPAKQARIFGDVNKRAMDQVPIIPWLWDAASQLRSPRIKNFRYYRLAAALDLAVVAVQ